MVTLGIDESGATGSDIEHGFWRRQFRPTTTRAQVVFDVVFGIVAPVLCFIFDPIVFKGEFDEGLFPQFQSFAYMVSAIEILLLIVWLTCGRLLHPRTRLVGGALAAGALFSGLIGIAILPFTLLGLFLGIGIFGFVPFLTGLVYLRNARSAFQTANDDVAKGPETFAAGPNWSGGHRWIGSTVVGCALALGLPTGLNFVAASFVTTAMNAVVNADAQRADLAMEEIRYLHFLAVPNFDELVSAYAAERDLSHKEELKRRYVKLTGRDIDERLRIMLD
jgi:hypothetical protein